MKEKVYQGNLLNSTAEIICHQCNCQGGFGAGVAKAIRDAYPRVYEQYKKAVNGGLVKLGMCQVVKTHPGFDDNRLVANLFGQETYGGEKKRYTNYEGIYVALEKLATYCQEHNIKSVAFPWKMSCGLAGAEWLIVNTMIETAFKNNDDIVVEYWKYND